MHHARARRLPAASASRTLRPEVRVAIETCVVDSGEAAAVMARLFAADATASRRVQFVERDPVLRRDVRAAIESLGVEVVGDAEPELP